MQSYDNFTVGGSLSVNAHGRYVGLGPIVLSVKSIRLVLADDTPHSKRKKVAPVISSC
jgi:FAD/FMN-containing dehydrogenase